MLGTDNSVAVKNLKDQYHLFNDGRNGEGAKLKLEAMPSTGHETFKSGYIVRSNGTSRTSGKYVLYFKVMDGDKDANMAEETVTVFVGYENITIDFSAVSVNNYGGNRPSSYDKTQSSIRLAGNQGEKGSTINRKNGLRLTVTANSGNNTDDNLSITRVTFENENKNLNLHADISGNEATLYYFETDQNSNAGPSGTLNKVNYVDVIKVFYTYNTYAGPKNGQKNFLVYHDEYYR
jgi:hypothetical protein